MEDEIQRDVCELRGDEVLLFQSTGTDQCAVVFVGNTAVCTFYLQITESNDASQDIGDVVEFPDRGKTRVIQVFLESERSTQGARTILAEFSRRGFVCASFKKIRPQKRFTEVQFD